MQVISSFKPCLVGLLGCCFSVVWWVGGLIYTYALSFNVYILSYDVVLKCLEVTMYAMTPLNSLSTSNCHCMHYVLVLLYSVLIGCSPKPCCSSSKSRSAVYSEEAVGWRSRHCRGSGWGEVYVCQNSAWAACCRHCTLHNEMCVCVCVCSCYRCWESNVSNFVCMGYPMYTCM